MLTAVMAGVILALVLSVIINLILFTRKGPESVRYVNQTGILKNPPSFVETWENKTINFNYDGLVIKFCHLPVRENLQVIAQIAGAFSIMQKGAEAFYKTPFTKDQAFAVYQNAFKTIIDLLYKLSKPHVKQFRFKKKFYSWAIDNSEEVFIVCSELFDYWQNMGKLMGAMGQGLSPRLKYGEDLFSDSLKWDSNGERLIKPRYGSIFQSSNKKPLKRINIGRKSTSSETPKNGKPGDK